MEITAADISVGTSVDGRIRLKREFRDGYDFRAYARAILLARRLLEKPDLVRRGRSFLERHVRTDPHQKRIYELWTETLQLPVDELVGRFLADDERGAALRETAPVFVVIPPEDVRALAKSIC
jgi:hypothetical protein